MESTQFDMDFLATETFALTEALRIDSSEYKSEISENQDFVHKDFIHKDSINIQEVSSSAHVEFEVEVELESANLTEVPLIEFTQYEFFPDVILDIPAIPVFIEEEIEEKVEETFQQEVFEETYDEEYLLEEEGLLATNNAYPTGPGVVFRLNAGASTFCVKGISTPNIAESFELLLEGNEDICNEFKFTEESDINEICFFETKTIELANSIRENHINRRFPIEEEQICNLSDPGFSWWLSEETAGFQIYFKSHGLDRAERYLRLGPIGDTQLAVMRLKQAESLIRGFFPVNEFAVTSKTFSIAAVNPNNLSYRILKDMFVSGINETSMSQFPASGLGRTLYNYFQEIAALRGFWIYLEDIIRSNK